jgi:hypothetical protein
VGGGVAAIHVSAGLGDDHLSHGLAHAWDRHQPCQLGRERAHLLLDARRQLSDRRGELVDALQMQPAQKRVMLTKVEHPHFRRHLNYAVAAISLSIV